jgi:hypothetical protein
MMTKRPAERWAVTRAKGRTRFIWLVGVALWGPITGVLWSVIMHLLLGWKLLRIFLPGALIIFCIAGYFFGAWTWQPSEDDYQEFQSRPPSTT